MPLEEKTAGQIQNEIVKKDHGSYSGYDLGYATCDSFWKELDICISNHENLLDRDADVRKIFPDDTYCIIVQHATDPLLITVLRRKFVPWPHLPDPRPMQSVFYFTRSTRKLIFLWALPGPETMAYLSEELTVGREYILMKHWCDWWFQGCFWTNIRKQYDITMLSEHEIMRMNVKMHGKPHENSLTGFDTDSFYLPEVRIKKLEAKANTCFPKLSNNIPWKPDALNRNLHLQNF